MMVGKEGGSMAIRLGCSDEYADFVLADKAQVTLSDSSTSLPHTYPIQLSPYYSSLDYKFTSVKSQMSCFLDCKGDNERIYNASI